MQLTFHSLRIEATAACRRSSRRLRRDQLDMPERYASVKTATSRLHLPLDNLFKYRRRIPGRIHQRRGRLADINYSRQSIFPASSTISPGRTSSTNDGTQQPQPKPEPLRSCPPSQHRRSPRGHNGRRPLRPRRLSSRSLGSHHAALPSRRSSFKPCQYLQSRQQTLVSSSLGK